MEVIKEFKTVIKSKAVYGQDDPRCMEESNNKVRLKHSIDSVILAVW